MHCAHDTLITFGHFAERAHFAKDLVARLVEHGGPARRPASHPGIGQDMRSFIVS